jgi:hypothetical protein
MNLNNRNMIFRKDLNKRISLKALLPKILNIFSILEIMYVV